MSKATDWRDRATGRPVYQSLGERMRSKVNDDGALDVAYTDAQGHRYEFRLSVELVEPWARWLLEVYGEQVVNG